MWRAEVFLRITTIRAAVLVSAVVTVVTDVRDRVEK
jgi:hypothetical protein